MIPNTEFNIWEHSQNVRQLYARRADGHDEMDTAAQAAEMLTPFINQWNPARSPRLLDAGCGSGYLYHSFKKRSLAIDYHGLDYSPVLVEIGQKILPGHGLPADRLICGAIEDLADQAFDLVVLLNTLTFCPDYRQPLDRLAETGARVIIIRDNFGPQTIIRWETDGYLDYGYNHLKAYWNQWNTSEVAAFLSSYGFTVEQREDRRTQGQTELVVDKPYHWSWLVASRP